MLPALFLDRKSRFMGLATYINLACPVKLRIIIDIECNLADTNTLLGA